MIDQLQKRRENIQQKTGSLKKCMDADFGLLDHLVTKNVFLPEVINEIRAEKTQTQQVEKILFHLRYAYEDSYNSFLDALHDSNQTHVVNFINGTHIQLYCKL